MKVLVITLTLLLFPYYNSIEAVAIKKVDIIETYIIELDELVILGSKYDRIADLSELDNNFKVKVDSFLIDCKNQGIDLLVFETYRTPERQNNLKKRGLSMLKGGNSKHQVGKAIDVVPIINGQPKWKGKGMSQLWYKIGTIGKKHGLIWGGDWKRFKDYPHFELKE